MTKTAIVLFEKDLRLSDHAPLSMVLQEGYNIVPLFIFDQDSDNIRPLGGASRWRLHQSLAALTQQLRQKGGYLVLRRGRVADVLPQVMAQTNASVVYAHSNPEPALMARDNALSVQVHRFAGRLLFDTTQICTGAGDYFKVFSPFWRHCLKQYAVSPPLPTPTRWHFAPPCPSDVLNDWQLLPATPNWAHGFTNDAGEEKAHAIAEEFFAEHLSFYKGGRDFPAKPYTTGLSAHIHFGEISVAQLWHAAEQAPCQKGISAADHRKSVDHFLSELGWREFSYHLLHHFPRLPNKNFRPQFDAFAWRHSPDDLKKWQQGCTGYPIIDAAMQCLRATGRMHNRVRMIAASFLVKHLLIDWRHGEAWFWDNLLDADLASNTASWQWVAGSGADAAPYFRIFNPLLQTERFDPDNVFVRQWLKTTTLQPIIGLEEGRNRALAAFEAMQLKRTAEAF